MFKRKKRNIFLYYGSIDTKSSIIFCVILFKSFFTSYKTCRKKLSNQLKIFYNQNEIEVYPFTSARGGLSAFLKATNSNARDVILSSYTCLAVPTAIIEASLNPIYCDVKKFSQNVDLDTLGQKISNSTHSVILQHTLGEVLDLDEIKKYQKLNNPYFIEDCALSFGSSYKQTAIGSICDVSIISLELSKIISVGWGGLLIVNKEDLKSKIDLYYENINIENFISSIKKSTQTIILGLCHNSMLYNLIGKYIIHLGYKYKLFRFSTPYSEQFGIVHKDFILRMSKIHLLFATYQFKRFKNIQRISNYNYTVILDTLNILGFRTFNEDSSIFSVSPRISFLVEDPKLATIYFEDKGISLGCWFDGPLSPQPQSDVFNYDNKSFPNSFFLAKHIVNLPTHSRLSKIDIEYIRRILKDFAQKFPNQIV